jgi:GGDEF domain-containing protein
LLGALAERNASGARRFALGMSVGLAHGDVVWAADEIPDLNALMRAADAALYVEKARKRARVALPGTALVG